MQVKACLQDLILHLPFIKQVAIARNKKNLLVCFVIGLSESIFMIFAKLYIW